MKAFTNLQTLNEELLLLLETAVQNHEYIEDEIGEEVALLHQKILKLSASDYSPQAHRAMVQTYSTDEKQKAYYDKHVDGCAAFLKSAVEYHIV